MALTSHGFTVSTVASGNAALSLAREVHLDIVVLEVDLAEVDGFDVLRRFRTDHLEVPVVFLTARSAVPDKITGLTRGAEDYITKPFSDREVALRLRVVLRRTRRPAVAPGPPRRWVVADVELAEDSHEVWKAGVAVALTPTEFRLLHYLMSNAGKVLSHASIIDHVWSHDRGGTNLVHNYIRCVRRKVDPEGVLLRTVRGVGYAIRAPR